MSKYINQFTQHLPEMKQFKHRHIKSAVTIATLVIAGISSWMGFWINGIGMSLLFTGIGFCIGVLAPSQIQMGLHKFYQWTTRSGNVGQITVEATKMVIAFFLSFLYFSALGLLASQGYRDFFHHARNNKDQDLAA